MEVQNNIIALEEIQKEFKNLSKDVFLILHIDNHSTLLHLDEFKGWTNKAKATISQLKAKYSNNQLLKIEFRAEISKLISIVNVQVDELLKEGLKKNGRIIGVATQFSIITDHHSLKNYITVILKELDKTESKINDNESPLPIVEPEYNTQIFKSYRGFKIFEAMIAGFPKVNDNYGFIFNKLIEDKLMFRVSHPIFKEFVNAKPYELALDKIKTLNVLKNSQRLALYSSILSSIK